METKKTGAAFGAAAGKGLAQPAPGLAGGDENECP
jgi:hypothetical protein